MRDSQLLLGDRDWKRLRYVRYSSPKLSLAHFPDFFVAGPQRSGSSWLYEQLKRHDGVLFSEPKELHFFNKLTKPASPNFRTDSLDEYLQCFRSREPCDRLIGEGTASYAAMNLGLISEALILNPRLKVIVVLRNVTDRLWSHARKYFRETIPAVPRKALEEFVERPYQARCADSETIVSNWGDRLAKGHLLVLPFELLIRDPAEFLARVTGFLNISPIGGSIPQVWTNAAPPFELPADLRRKLEERYGRHERWRRRFFLRRAWPASLFEPDGGAG